MRWARGVGVCFQLSYPFLLFCEGWEVGCEVDEDGQASVGSRRLWRVGLENMKDALEECWVIGNLLLYLWLQRGICKAFNGTFVERLVARGKVLIEDIC